MRTKRVTHEDVPTVDNVCGITSYGPTATLFTVGPNHTVQQYDINPSNSPMLVASIQHVPANAPPTPPDSIEEHRARSGSISEDAGSSQAPSPPPQIDVESSEEEGFVKSPLEKIYREMEQLEEERKDEVGPLSPMSSRASLSSASSSYAGRRRASNRAYSSKAPSASSSQHTFFSVSSPSVAESRESVSIRSMSSASASSSRHASSRSHHPRSTVDESTQLDLFPFTKARLGEVKFRAPQYGAAPNPDSLRREMLSVVFGWDEDAETLIRTEQAYHSPTSPAAVLLSKWLGELGSDSLAQMAGSEAMSSSDWMILALSLQMNQGSQKQVGEAFVGRLLQKNDVHPAVAILIGLGEINDAIEAYVSRKYYMEAVILTCLMFPSDWQRQSYLVRKWGEASVAHGQHEFAVRCFSCTSIESSEPWFSPRAQDAVYAAQSQVASPMSPLNSPPSATPSSRIASKNASLGKLVTNFGREKQDGGRAHALNLGVTPIIDSAISPGGPSHWKRSQSRDMRDPSSARTATPGGYGRRRRGPSMEPGIREVDDENTPYAASRRLPSRPSSRVSNKDPGTAIKVKAKDSLPEPAAGVFALRKEASRTRDGSRDRNPHRLQLTVNEPSTTAEASSPHPSTSSKHTRATRSNSSLAKEMRPEDLSPLLTDGSTRSYKERSIDRYISSLEDSSFHQGTLRAESNSRNDRSRSRPRPREESQSRKDTTMIKPSKRSPSSPAAMSTEDAHKYPGSQELSEDERAYYGLTSPVESTTSTRQRGTSKPSSRRVRDESPKAKAGGRSGSRAVAARGHSRVRQASPERYEHEDDRGRSDDRYSGGNLRYASTSSMERHDEAPTRQTVGAEARARSRQRSSSRLTSGRARSSSRRPKQADLEPRSAIERGNRLSDDFDMESLHSTRPRTMSRSAAQQSLEERRLSLARRPSAPSIPLPGYHGPQRPGLSPRSITDSGSPILYDDTFRSRTVDPMEMMRHNAAATGASTASPPIGLPATPRAMRLSKYNNQEAEVQEGIPAVPALPSNFTLMPTTYQPSLSPAKRTPQDELGPLLPSTTYTREPVRRSSSAPPDRGVGLPPRPRRDSHARRGSDRDGRGSEAQAHVKETIAEEDNIIVVEEPAEAGSILPELAHLTTPPPPPPPPAFPGLISTTSPSGVINIAIEGSGQMVPGLSTSRTTTPATNSAHPDNPTPSASPNLIRKTHGSGSSVSETTITGKWGKLRDRMRETSRPRRNTKSPVALATAAEPFNPSPYESVLSGLPFDRTKSPPYAPTSYSENAILGTQLPQRPVPLGSPDPAYRNPKEIRANMPPEQLQAGVYVPLHDTFHPGHAPPSKGSADHGSYTPGGMI